MKEFIYEVWAQSRWLAPHFRETSGGYPPKLTYSLL
jgi:hypothetical protein